MTGFLWWHATSLKPGRPFTMTARQFSFPSALFGCRELQPCREVVRPLAQVTDRARWFTRPDVQK
jgi:hypothetical protein